MEERPVRSLVGTATRRAVVAGVFGIGLVAAALTVAHGGARTVPMQVTSSPYTQDVIQYVETTGNNGTYFQYIPVTGKSVSEAITSGGGGCSSPTPAGTPMLNFAARVNTVDDYSGTWITSGVSVGAYKQRTGVCGLQSTQDWSIDSVPGTGAEALDFSVGSNSALVPSEAGRVFTEALLDVARTDKLSGTATVQLVEYLAGTEVGTQCYQVPSTGTAQLDTSAPGTGCTANNGQINSGFDTVEVRVPTAGESASVVGPSSTFFLAPTICSGFISTSTPDGVNGSPYQFQFTATDTAGVCKSYSALTAVTTNDGDKTASFDSFGAPGTEFQFSIDWGLVPYCTPAGATACAATEVSVGGGAFAPQTFCAQEVSPGSACTTSRDFSYVNVGGTTYTHITETWDSLIDITFHYGG